MAMRSADGFRVCQFPLSGKPSKVCGEPLHGRGRWKWCAEHSQAVRDERNRVGNARWQRNWRRRHPEAYKKEQLIYRTAAQITSEMLEMFPEAPATAVYARAIADLRGSDSPRTEFNWGRPNKSRARALSSRWDPNEGQFISFEPDFLNPKLIPDFREIAPWIIFRLEQFVHWNPNSEK